MENFVCNALGHRIVYRVGHDDTELVAAQSADRP